MGPRKTRMGLVFRAAGLGMLLGAALLAPAQAKPSHGLSAFGDLKYGPDFTHFAYVNPDAPKGGRLSMIGTAGRITFDSFNGYILKGVPAQGLGLLFDSLMTRAWDEPDAVYGLVASTAEVAEDRKSVIFTLRPEAKFADGSPLTAQDVAFTFNLLKAKGHPYYRILLKDVVAAEALDATHVRYRFQGNNTRDLPLIVATLPIFSADYYAKHRFDQTTLKPPLGSGPYEISDFKQGRYVTYRRRKDYWGWHLPVNRGRFNFDELRYEYFRDRTAEFEALKAGDYDLREEFTSRDWATAYDIPQVKSGKLKRLVLPDKSPSGAQGFFINTRRKKFQDVRVRKALDYAFDFEWTNRNLFYNSYTRTASFFENSPMKAEGPPSPEELAILAPFRDQLPKEVFGPPYVPPVSDGSGQDRKLLRQARKLLAEAGWTIQREPLKKPEDCGWLCRLGISLGLSSEPTRPVLRNAKGEAFTIEFLIFSPSFERVIAPYVKNLAILGIQATIRRVDPAQYEERVKSFDFDITTQRYVMKLTPGVELRNYWGAAAAKQKGSFNLSGIASPVIDALIEKVVAAKSRKELVTAARALDRVLRAGHYWVPHWYKPSHWVAYWDKFSRPAKKPDYDRGIIETWWYDPKKAARLTKP